MQIFRSQTSHQLFERNRQLSDSFAGCVKDGIGDRRRDADDADLADALAAECRRMVIRDADGDHLNIRHVGIGRYEIVTP